MSDKSKKIIAEISSGELFDKITILEIKLTKITDQNSQIEIKKELESLKNTRDENILPNENLSNLYNDLKKINLSLWDIEDKIRYYEKKHKFEDQFIELARKVYFENDKRAKIKSKINSLLKSNIVEIKKYTNY